MKVVTFGEIMLRLCPEGYLRFFQNDKMEATFGGAEANVAVSLANFGIDSLYVTKLPDNPIGRGALSSLRSFGVDTSQIVFGGDRLGIYFLEKGAAQRGSLCVYDRAGSAIQKATREDFNWDAIFEGACWFHFTGITPALSPELVEILQLALAKAKERNITVSCDLNYRSKLWSRDEAREAMTKLCGKVDVLIANEEDVKDVFGIKPGDSDITGGRLSTKGYEYQAQKLREAFGFKYVAFTLRSSVSASDNYWKGVIYDGSEFFYSKEYLIHIVDRVGGGDSFGAGLIYSLLNGKDMDQTINFAVAASCLKQSIEGDFNRVSVKEVEKLSGGDASGRVVR
ncbi:MAG: sugar kinase [Clostridia bacterium]|nr:sugar kinase [Clostridia bacterium]